MTNNDLADGIDWFVKAFADAEALKDTEPDRWARACSNVELDLRVFILDSAPALTSALRAVDGEWLIWSNEHGAWWRANSAGYTVLYDEAGRYSFAKATEICNQACYRAGHRVFHNNAAPPETMIPVAGAQNAQAHLAALSPKQDRIDDHKREARGA